MPWRFKEQLVVIFTVFMYAAMWTIASVAIIYWTFVYMVVFTPLYYRDVYINEKRTGRNKRSDF